MPMEPIRRMWNLGRAVVVGACALALGLGVCGMAGCGGEQLTPPEVLVSPYGPTSADGGPPVWAVVPLANESGTSAANVGQVSDAVVARVAEVRGLAVLPLNRTLAGMRAMGMDAVRSPADARALARTLGADGIIVGTITAYDPYDPPRLGLTLGLFTLDRAGPGLDPQTLRTAGSEPAVGAGQGDAETVVSDYVDAANHEVLMELKRFASGRHEPESALGWRRYTASMPLFTEFAAHRAVGRLLERERLRLARSGGVGGGGGAGGPVVGGGTGR
jgi:hypothetical protein